MADEKDPEEHSGVQPTEQSDGETAVKHESDIERPEEPPGGTEHDEQQTPKIAAEPPTLLKGVKVLSATTKGRILLAVAGVVLVLGVLFAVPTTRYGILGLVIKKDVTLTLTDSQTKKPVTDAEARVAGQSAKSDSQGNITFHGVPVGPQHITIAKKYYKEIDVIVDVWLTKSSEPASLSLEATGRQVPVKVINRISGEPIEKVAITALDATAITDSKGEATVVLPVGKTTQAGKIRIVGYNELKINLTVTEQAIDGNTFAMTPYGKVYFLSKRTGKINVMKSDLDGANQQVVLAGTGKEADTDTILLASRDWKYLVLKASRDSDKAKIYIIDTAKDSVVVADEGDAEFTLSGWAEHRLVYTVFRNTVQSWQPKQSALKSFDAERGKLTTLDETAGEGTGTTDYAREQISNATLLGSEVVYTKVWGTGYYNPGRLIGKKKAILSAQTDGTSKKIVKEFSNAPDGYIESRQYTPTDIFFRVWQDGGMLKGYEYSEGKIKDKDISDKVFYATYPTYLVSPSGQATFWSESRDGKNTLIVGDKAGSNGKPIAELSEYRQYGWFTDDYLLVSKSGSELYILPNSTVTKPLKITDYHKPDSYLYYGGGYGGL